MATCLAYNRQHAFTSFLLNKSDVSFDLTEHLMHSLVLVVDVVSLFELFSSGLYEFYHDKDFLRKVLHFSARQETLSPALLE